MAFLSIRIKVSSHTTIFRLIFSFDTVFNKNRSVWTQKSKVKLKHCFKIGWHPISVRQSNENCMARMVKIRNFFKIEWKLWLGEHVAIRLSCSTDAESFKIQTENCIKWPHFTTWLDNSQDFSDCYPVYRRNLVNSYSSLDKLVTYWI